MNTIQALMIGTPLVCGGAMAQSTVTLGGIVDGGVVMVKRGNGWEKMVQSGNFYGSRLIINAVEDLGDGLKAQAYLEPGLLLDTGVAAATFFRRSFVGLEGPFGRLDLGRDYNPMFSVVVRTDPFEAGTLASAPSFQVAAGAQANNAIFYTTPNLGGLKAKVMYSMGESSTAPTDKDKRLGANALWDMGQVTAFAAWGRQLTQVGPATVSTADSQTMVGARYNVAGGWITASYQIGHNNSGSTAYASNNGVAYAKSFATALIGVRMPVSGTAVSLGATYQAYNDHTATNRDASVLGVGMFYSLFKRTTLYANAAVARNKNGQKFTLVDAGRNSYNYSPAAGTTVNPQGVALGMRHTF
jgi:GBP family porin